MRIALGVEYDGAGFCGWQLQTGVRTVQGELEAALSKVAAQPVRVVCAGRTDTGVHATGQVVHFDTPAERPLRAWTLGANVNLPDDVSVRWAQPVSDDFHARFRATARNYRYIIANTFTRPALQRRRVCWHHYPIEAERMHEAGQCLVGEHDFSSFRALACQAKHAVREVRQLTVQRRGTYVILDICANAFLHHMVRNIAGVLLAVGTGDREPQWVQELLALRDRTRGGVTAPAGGLYLVQVQYPVEFGLPAPESAPWLDEL